MAVGATGIAGAPVGAGVGGAAVGWGGVGAQAAKAAAKMSRIIRLWGLAIFPPFDRSQLRRARSAAVLLVPDLLQPVGGLAVEIFLNGDVRHGCGCRGAMPVFLSRQD